MFSAGHPGYTQLPSPNCLHICGLTFGIQSKPHSPPPHTGSSPGMVASFHSSFTWVVVHLLLHRRKVLLSQEALLANLWHTSFILTSPSLSPFRGPTLTSWSTSISGTSMEWPMKTILLDHMHQSSHLSICYLRLYVLYVCANRVSTMS